MEKSGFHHEIPDNKELLHDECYYRGGGGDNVFVCRHVPPPATSRDSHEVMRHDQCRKSIHLWSCTITEKALTRAFSWLKAPTTAFTFKTLLRHYAKQALTPRPLNVKLGPRRNYHKGRAAIRHYANQPARPLWTLRRGPNFTLRDRGVNVCLA